MPTKTPAEDFASEIASIVENVNRILDAMKRPDLHIAPDMFGFEDSGSGGSELQLIHVRIPIDAGADIRLTGLGYRLPEDNSVERYSGDLAMGIWNLDRARNFLARYRRSVQAATKRAIKAKSRDDLQLKLIKVGFKDMDPYHLNYPSWKDAASHVLSEVYIQKTKIVVEEESVVIEEPEHVADELDRMDLYI